MIVDEGSSQDRSCSLTDHTNTEEREGSRTNPADLHLNTAVEEQREV